MTRRLLIAGCGYVGREVARLAAARGDAVWALRRSDADPPDGVRPLRADVTVPESLALPDALDGVVYAVSPGGFEEAAYRRAYVDGLANVLDVLERRGDGPRPRVVLVSATSVYGATDGREVDETTPAEPLGFWGAAVRAGEQRLEASPLEGASLRLGGIYGPGRERKIESVRSGRAARYDGPPRYTNRIHRDDAARAALHLLDLDPLARVYVGVDEDPAPDRDVVEWLAKRLGVEVPSLRSAGERPASRRPGNKRCRSDRLRASGFAFAYPTFREGYAALLAAR